MLDRLQLKTSYSVLFPERVQALIPTCASFADVGCRRGAVVLELN